MILSALLALAAAEPTPDQTRTCRAHMELFIEDVAREGGQIAGPTWFIRDWWDRQAEEAEAPDDGGAAAAARKAELERQRASNPDEFQTGRGVCVDTALDAGAVPGMARVRPA